MTLGRHVIRQRACLVLPGLAVFTLSCGRPQSPPASAPDEENGRGLAYWNARVSDWELEGRPVEALRQALGGEVLDEGRIVAGGAGNHTVHFLLPGLIVISADADVHERIVGRPWVRRTSTWPKTSDGYLDYPITQSP